jgi:hypothetical protein
MCSLGVQTDWKRFSRISGLRNDIEHYCTGIHPDAISGMISDTLVIIRDFVHNELALDPKDELGDEAWATLLSVSEVFEKERAYCRQLLESIDWGSEALEAAISEATCYRCGSALIAPISSEKDSGFQCRSCGETAGFETFAERALSDSLGWRNHYAVFNSTFGFGPEELSRGIVKLTEVREVIERNASRWPIDNVVGYLEIAGPKIGRDYSDPLLVGQLRDSLRAIKEVFCQERMRKSRKQVAAADLSVRLWSDS